MNMLSKVIDKQKPQFADRSEPPDLEPPRVENTPYVANMRALCKHSPILAHKIDSVDELDFIPCEKTRSGEWTCQWTGPNGKSVFIHSRYNPTREAQRWADGVEELAKSQIDEDSGKVPMCYFIDGLGLGYHVRLLYERLEGEAFIVVSEPSVAMIRTAMEHFDFSQMLLDERLVFITADDRAEIFKRLQQHSHVMMMGVVFTHPLQRIESEFHARVHVLITEYTSFMRANLWTLLGCSLQTCKNVIHNLPAYVSTPSIEILQKRFAGCPAVLVSAGPSLRKNITLLKQIRHRVVVIAVQTVLKPLLASGIEPDFVTSLDFADVCKRFFDGLENLPNVHLVAEPKAHWDVIDCYRSIGPMTLLGNEFARLLLEGQSDPHASLTAGTTVAHLSFYLAEYIGADPIILIGQDLGFTNHVYYSPGNALHDIWQPELNRFCTIEMKEFERILRQGKSLRKVKDHLGQAIYTDEEMFTYLQQFERDFDRSKATVIDASEGGVKKQFCRTMPLAEAAETFCKEPIDRERFSYRQRVKWFDPTPLDGGLKLLNQRIKDVKEFHDIVKETIDLVKEMLTLIDNQSALNQKMIRLDELRTMVNQRLGTYKLVGNVSQTAELNRFRLDRAIGVENKQGTDRQRQQLCRDVAYVSELDKGCLRLLDLLNEGVERFEEELQRQDSSVVLSGT